MTISMNLADFLRLVQQSGVTDVRTVEQHLSRLGIAANDQPARGAAEALVRDGVLTQFQAEQLLQGKWRGFQVGKYRILERIGSGGMGQVFLCRHLHLPTVAALKVLPPSGAASPSALGRFYREARAAAALHHPHLVRTHDVGQDGDLHYIVMEYVHGPNLMDVVKKFGPLSIERTIAYLYQIADALDYAHQKGLVHRDIKPGNILVDCMGQARLLDLGLARFYHDEEDNLTVMYDDKMVLGTADYVAPEQIANSHTADIRADIYALGATAYFLLAGHPLFPSGTVSQKLIWHGTREPEPIQQIRPEVPQRLAEVIHRMLAKEPEGRYQTPAELQTALLPLLPLDPPPLPEAEMPQYSPLVMRLLAETGLICGHTPRTPPPLRRGIATATSWAKPQAAVASAASPAKPQAAVASAASPAKPQAAVASAASPAKPQPTQSYSPALLSSTPPPKQQVGLSADTDCAALDHTPGLVQQPPAPLIPPSAAQPEPAAAPHHYHHCDQPTAPPTLRRYWLIVALLLLLSIVAASVAWYLWQ
jgi:serine/threonine protein kinase